MLPAAVAIAVAVIVIIAAMVQCAQEMREQGQFLSAIAGKSHWASHVIGATDVQAGGVLVCGSLG